MNDETLARKAEFYLKTLCEVLPHRRTGSSGNRVATDFFQRVVSAWSYAIDATPFPCLDFESGDTSLICGSTHFDVRVSPFSRGCDVTAELVTAGTVEELEASNCAGKLMLLQGTICAEPLMPKNFPFYSPDHHKRVYALLEEKQPAAVISATTTSPAVAESRRPFPLFEDGDFDIPSVYCLDTVGGQIVEKTGGVFTLRSTAKRIPTTACNVIARKNTSASEKIVICAHIDAVENTPGATDNASGIVVELLLAEMLSDYQGVMCIEIVAFNGEDYYSTAGQMDYLKRYSGDSDKILLAVNIDGVGYIRGKVAYSLYQCSEVIRRRVLPCFSKSSNMMEGEQWYQGDHMVFVQKEKPSIAITSEMASELLAEITHTPKDTPEIVDCSKLVELASALRSLLEEF